MSVLCSDVVGIKPIFIDHLVLLIANGLCRYRETKHFFQSN